MNILLIGYGGIGKKHFKILKNKNHKIFIVDKHNKTFSKISNLAKEKIDYAIISTPPNTHLRYATLMTKLNIPFLLEKPLGNSVKGWKNLDKIIKKKKLVCGVAYPRRNHDFFKKIKSKILKGYIGKVKLIKCNFSQDFRKYRTDYANIYYSQKNNAGGLVTDALIHHINLVNYFYSNPKIIFSKIDNLVIKNLKVEDFAHVLLKYNKNIYCIFSSNHFQKNYEDKIKFIGTKGTITINRYKNEVLYHFNDKKPIRQKINFDWNLLLKNQIDNFEKSLRNKVEIKTSILDALKDLKICKQILSFKKK